MARAKTTTVYRAKKTFHRGRHYIEKGKDYQSDHPAVDASPGAFERIRVESHDDSSPEQATAAPGEKRTTTTRHDDDS